ncbi:MAG: LegC family aminotransferase [Crocinitomicaceae bacterium]
MDNKKTISFIKSIFGTNEFIPLHVPSFNGNEKKYLIDCIDSTFVSSVGPYVTQFEKEIAKYSGSNYGVAVVNGTAALHTALNILGIQKDDEVLTQGLTFVATANAIAYCHAHPVFIDVDMDTMGLSPTALSLFLDANAEIRDEKCYNKITKRRISACIPMHTFGFPCRIIEICKICKQWGIPVIEDAAEALGSSLNDQKMGTFGDIGVFSFNGNKVITAGGGGALVTNNKDLALKAKHLTTTGKTPHPFEFHHDEVAYNYRMPNINAALICAQLEQLDHILLNKRTLANQYRAFFENSSYNFRWETAKTKVNFWLNCLEFNSKEERDQFLKDTNENNIMTRPIWQLMFRLPMFKSCQTDEQTNALYLEERIVNLPSSYRKNG